jgi:Ni,Fe-hydrogenase I small subunit
MIHNTSTQISSPQSPDFICKDMKYLVYEKKALTRDALLRPILDASTRVDENCNNTMYDKGSIQMQDRIRN